MESVFGKRRNGLRSLVSNQLLLRDLQQCGSRLCVDTIRNLVPVAVNGKRPPPPDATHLRVDLGKDPPGQTPSIPGRREQRLPRRHVPDIALDRPSRFGQIGHVGVRVLLEPLGQFRELVELGEPRSRHFHRIELGRDGLPRRPQGQSPSSVTPRPHSAVASTLFSEKPSPPSVSAPNTWSRRPRRASSWSPTTS